MNILEEKIPDNNHGAGLRMFLAMTDDEQAEIIQMLAYSVEHSTVLPPGPVSRALLALRVSLNKFVWGAFFQDRARAADAAKGQAA